MIRLLFILSATILMLSSVLTAEDMPSVAHYSGPGMNRLEFKTDPVVLIPGGTFTAGLVIDPEPGHHTYWRGPGIVGVPTLIEWDLPEGFKAGPIQWPAPEKVDMVGITANGYLGKKVLLTEIQVPDQLPQKVYRFEAKVAWMSCSTSCNPGVTRLYFSLPANAAWNGESREPAVESLFEAMRDQFPSSMPEGWSISVRMEEETTTVLSITIPEMEPSGVDGLEFFCDDMQVDSNKPTRFTWIDEQAGAFELRMKRPDFAPSNSEFSGVLKGDQPWPGSDSCFVELSTTWPEGTFDDE